MKTIVVTLCFILLVGGHWTPRSAKQEGDEQKNVLADLRNEVKQIISPTCGGCHTSSLPTAKPGAVKVFDLARDDWPVTMSPARLEKFKGRLSSLNDTTRTKINEFVEAELKSRPPDSSH